MPREVAVSLHDIEPGTFEHCALIREWLADLGVERVTLCVVEPGRALGEWLRARRAAGDAIAPDPGLPARRVERRDGALHVHVHPDDFDAHPWATALLARVLRHEARRRRLRSDAPGVTQPSMKLLVLTPEPIDASALRSAVGDEAADAEVMVVSPATNASPLRFWMSDADEAIAEAHQTVDETVELLEEEGIDAAGDTGESEPALALQDALATFPADRIVVFTHPKGERDYREDDSLRDAEGRFGVPVTFAEL